MCKTLMVIGVSKGKCEISLATCFLVLLEKDFNKKGNLSYTCKLLATSRVSMEHVKSG